MFRCTLCHFVPSKAFRKISLNISFGGVFGCQMTYHNTKKGSSNAENCLFELTVATASVGFGSAKSKQACLCVRLAPQLHPPRPCTCSLEEPASVPSGGNKKAPTYPFKRGGGKASKRRRQKGGLPAAKFLRSFLGLLMKKIFTINGSNFFP